MAPLLKSLFGNGSEERELSAEVREVLREIRKERERFETLLVGARAASEQLETLGGPIAKAADDVEALVATLHEVQPELDTVTRLTARLQSLELSASELAEGQREAEGRITAAVGEAQRTSASLEEFTRKVESALELKDRLERFLEVEKPFAALRGEAETLRGQVEGTGEQVARLREQNDRLMDAHKLAVTKIEALERRRDNLGRELSDKERRVSVVEQAVHGMDGVQRTLDEVRREMGTLKATADLVAQKTAALDAQREVADRALAQAEQLDRAMRQIDARVQHQQENERNLARLNDQVAALRALHETVVERSGEITKLQRDTDEQIRATRQELAAVMDEMKKTVERFDFEGRGLEAVSQRVTDLRGALADFEQRFQGLSQSSLTVAELDARSVAVGHQLRTLADEVGKVERETHQLRGLRRDLDEAGRTVRDLATKVSRIEEARPAVEGAVRDLAGLVEVRASVADALEQARIAHDEIARAREGQSGVRGWLAEVEQAVGGLREQVAEVRALVPTVDAVHKQAQRVAESMSALETRREFAEDMHRRLAELGSIGARLDERDRQLQSRMDAAEQRFLALGAHAEEADRIRATIVGVSAAVADAERKAGAVGTSVAALGVRCDEIEELAERTRVLGDELNQRQHALAEAAKDLKKSSALRQEAAGAAQKLEGLAQRLGETLAEAEHRVAELDALSRGIEDRAAGLDAVEGRLGQFESRLTAWELVEQNVDRSLAQIAARQGTIETLQADLDRMLVTTEKTSAQVREITSARREVEDHRKLLDEVVGRLREVRGMAGALDERERQMAKAEERLARAEALLGDVGTSLETLQGQKAIVDLAVEKAGSLQSLLKQAESAIDSLREERDMTARVRAAVQLVRRDDEDDDAGAISRAA